MRSLILPDSLADIPAVYLVHGRSVLTDRAFTDEDHKFFIQSLRMYEEFLGVRVLFYTLMPDHFHLLVHVPNRPAKLPDDRWLLKNLERIRSPVEFELVRSVLEAPPKSASAAERAAVRETLYRLMWDIGQFIRHVKMKTSKRFNQQRKRRGMLWEARCTRLLVEPASHPLSMVAGYLALNPVRAKLAKDPADYPWTSYSAAISGDADAARDLRLLFRLATGKNGKVKSALTWLREPMFDFDLSPTARQRLNLPEAPPCFSRADFLRHHVRYFTHGTAIGSPAFLESLFQALRDEFGPNRSDGARLMTGLDPAHPLHSLRNLRLDAIAKPRPLPH